MQPVKCLISKDTKNISLTKIKADIINILLEKKISLSELARITGIQQSTLHKALHSSRDIHYSNVVKICNALNLNIGAPFYDSIHEEIALPLFENIEDTQNINLSNINSTTWRKWVIINDAGLAKCVAICSKQLLNKIFTSRAIMIVNVSRCDSPLDLYIKDNYFNINAGDKLVGSIKKILF